MEFGKINSNKITLLFEAYVLSRLTDILPKESQNRKGGWFCLVEAVLLPGQSLVHRTVLHGSIGEMDEERSRHVRAFSMEKAQRLGRHPEHGSSRESANSDSEQYPGALRYDDGLIGSFSGFSAAVDEAIVAFIGVQCAFVNERTIWERLGDEGREYYTKLIEGAPLQIVVVSKK